jgi:hypothetical protein
MTGRRAILSALMFGATVPLFAHGEEALIYPGTLALLFILALVMVATPWHKWWARGIAAVVLLASNVALWFSPLGDHPANLDKVTVMLLVIPMAIAAAVIALLLRVGRR